MSGVQKQDVKRLKASRTTHGGMLSDSIHADRIVAAVRAVRTAIATHTHVEMPPR